MRPQYYGLFVLLLMGTVIRGEVRGPFSSLQLVIQIVNPGNDQILQGYWTPEKGIEMLIITPFYWGEIHAGGQARSFSGTETQYPDYKSISPFLGWGLSTALPYNIKGYLGIRVGFNHMIFDTLSGYQRDESEVSASINATVTMPISSQWTARLTAGRETVFTFKRIRLMQYSAGLGYTFRTPSWLKEFLE